jgi:hypothetical protein
VTKPLIERLARIIDPDLWALGDEDPSMPDPTTQAAYVSSLIKAARCIAEVTLEQGSTRPDVDDKRVALAINLHVADEATVVSNAAGRLLVRCGPGAMSESGKK